MTSYCDIVSEVCLTHDWFWPWRYPSSSLIRSRASITENLTLLPGWLVTVGVAVGGALPGGGPGWGPVGLGCLGRKGWRLMYLACSKNELNQLTSLLIESTKLY